MPFYSKHDERLEWIETEFPAMMLRMNTESERRGLQLLTPETWEALQLSSLSTLAFIRHLLDQGYLYVLTRQLNSDPVESTFCSVRRLCGSNDKVDARSGICEMEKILRA